MRAVIVSQSDLEGGAAIAAYRLLNGLNQTGVSARMIVGQKKTKDPLVHQAIPDPDSVVKTHYASDFFRNEIQSQHIDKNRSPLSDTLFSFPYPALDISQIPAIKHADVVNFHWVNGLLSPATMKRIINTGIPSVWTLHDMWPFTGGCHYTASCEGFRHECAACPQLRNTNFGITEAVLRDKIECLSNESLTVVTCSNWLKGEAQRSALFRNHRIECIPNGLDTSIFNPKARVGAKTQFGIEESDIVLMFGATHGRSLRKGFDLLAKAIIALSEDTLLKEWLGRRKIVVLSLGHPSQALQNLPVSICDVGYKHTDPEIAQVYGAADVFVLPSREDNLPNTIMEAMACGCVPVAFDIGGVSDLYQDGEQGYLVPPFDVEFMVSVLKQLIRDDDKRRTMGQAATEEVSRKFTLQIQAQRYLKLYEELAESNEKPFPSGYRSRYSAPLSPYPSDKFGGDGGSFFRILLFYYYSTLPGQVMKTSTKALLFVLIRRCYRKLSEMPLIGRFIASIRGNVAVTSRYGKWRAKMASGVKDID